MLSSTEVADSYVIGDYIGVESCLDLKDRDNKKPVSGALMEISTIARGDELENIVESRDDYDDDGNYYRKYSCRGKREQRLVAWKKKEFPPPIPSLARTGNLSSHMPWVLKRHYTSDGRLVLTEEKVRHHEYFRAHRANGRLTLQLVPLDNYKDAWLSRPPSADDEHDDYGANEEPLMMSDPDQDHQEKDQHVHHDNEDEDHIVNGGDHLLPSGDDDEVEKEIMEKDWRSSVVEDLASMNGSSGILGVNGAGKCLNYNNMSTSGSSCIFGVPVIGEISTVRS